MSDKVKCSQGHENLPGANFCLVCGEGIGGGQMKCHSCGAMNDSGSNFCGSCGGSLKKNPSAEIEHMRWQRGVDDFATRVDIEDLSGVLKKGIMIEQGTQALLFVNGGLAEILPPGMYELGGLAGKLRHFEPYRAGTAILIDSGEVEIKLNLTGIYTKDPFTIDVTCNAVAQVTDPALFFNNVLKGRKNYPLSELRISLSDEMQNAFNEVIGQKSMADLNWDLSLKREFEVFVEGHLDTTFQRTGLHFLQLRTIDYRFRGYDRIRGMHEEVFLLVGEEEAKLQKRKRLYDVFDKDQLQEIMEDTRKADHYEKKVEVLKRVRNLDVDKIRDADEFEAFVLEMDKGKMLRTDEVEALKNSFAQSGLRREFLLKKIDLEQEIEYEGLRLVGKEESELKRYEVESKRKRKEFEDELWRLREKAGEDREAKVREAETQAKVQSIEHQRDREEVGNALQWLKSVKETKIWEERERTGVELDKLEKLSKLGIEALIHASGEEQARLLMELRRSEILKGMSDDQILAMGALSSPEVAKAFQEKFKACSSEKSYEKIIADIDKMHAETMRMVQEIFTKSLETQRDVSVSAAQGPNHPAVYRVTGQPATYFGPSGVETVICPKCKSRVFTGQKYCTNCGNEMF